MTKEVLDGLLSDLQEFFKNDYSGHDYNHTMRVYKLAYNIAIQEHANLEIVSLAALLHDVDDVKLTQSINYQNARLLMNKYGIDKVQEEVIAIIQDVSFKGNQSKSPSTLEGKIVQDADRLDAIGAIGIARAFTFGGNHNRPLYNDENPVLNMDEASYRQHKSSTINHFYEKLLLLKDMMNTDTAKELAYQRHQFMKNYLEEFYDEIEGKK
ncbi:HD domain-containing protein [Sharpea azabuensis]|uniref:HD domain-containing protein n=1 Tax=Sharpea porci TaxID=2652286 RepID=A0A844FTJ0_9FIRM|nr:HD domain-containing protein [Sharpea porci]MST89308.1 HD domain-containing protein [Sharpea porci]